jgi:hypothetical protein
MEEFVNVDNDGLNPPEDSIPEPVEGAIAYKWNPGTQTWEPIFES